MKSKIKKAITVTATAVTAIAVMAMSATPVLANEALGTAPVNAPVETAQIVPFFGTYTGIVKEVTERENKSLFVELESETAGPSNFVITKDVYRVDNVEIKKGQTLIGFYENNRPMIMIYPPQYNVSIVAEIKDNLFVEADKFDKDLVNMDNSLKLNISEDTEIVWENGTQISWVKAPTTEELAAALGERRLVVFYDITTKSIPAQTTPKKIIVLSKKESKPVSDVSGFDIEVNGSVITSPNAFKATNGAVMLPVRAITQALGMKVEWKGETKTVTVGENVSFAIENKTYQAYGLDIALETAPVLKDGLTYVPMEFFERVLPLYDANVYEGRIVFNN